MCDLALRLELSHLVVGPGSSRLGQHASCDNPQVEVTGYMWRVKRFQQPLIVVPCYAMSQLLAIAGYGNFAHTVNDMLQHMLLSVS